MPDHPAGGRCPANCGRMSRVPRHRHQFHDRVLSAKREGPSADRCYLDRDHRCSRRRHRCRNCRCHRRNSSFQPTFTTTTTSLVAPEPNPAAIVTAPTAEECARVRERFEEVSYEGALDMLLDRAPSDPKSTSTSGLDRQPTELARVLSDAELETMDACSRATEAACARLSELVTTQSAPTNDAVADCSTACETYPAAACTPPCIWGLFGFGDHALGGCWWSPICDPARDGRLSPDSTLAEPPWDLPPPGWVPPTPECVPICDIDRDGYATARDYAGDCAEVATWLAHDCETQSAGFRAGGGLGVSDRTWEKHSDTILDIAGRLLALCHDADLAGMATLPPTLWHDASIIHRSSSASEVLGKPPNIDLLTRYRCAGRLTDPCIDYSR